MELFAGGVNESDKFFNVSRHRISWNVEPAKEDPGVL